MLKSVRADAIARLEESRGHKIVRGWGLSGPGPALFGWWALWPSGRRDYLGPTLAKALGANLSLSAAADKAKEAIKGNGIALLAWSEGYGAWMEHPLAPGEHPRRALLAARRRYAAMLLEPPPTYAVCMEV